MNARLPRAAFATALACLAVTGALGCGDGPAGVGDPAPATQAPAAPAPAAAAVPPPAQPPAAAPAPAEPVSVGIVADTPDGRVAVALAAGERRTVAFRVVNAGEAARAFLLAAADRAPGEGFAPAAEGAPANGVGLWLTAPARVVVPARQSLLVEAVLAVPAGAPAGVHEGALVARAESGPAGAGASVDVSYRAAARVRVEVR